MATIERVSPTSSRRVAPSLHTLMGIQVLATGSHAPSQVVDNEQLASLGYDADWIVQRTGIQSRRCAPAGVATSDLAFEASRRCLEDAGMTAEELDLILVATITPDTPMPSTACHLQRLLGARAPAMDLSAACSGFLYGLATAAQFIKTGHSQRVLVVGADLMSRTVNPQDKKTFPLFGDGAGAVIVGAGDEEQGLLAYSLGADGEGADLLCTPAGGSREPIRQDTLEANRHYMHMEGRPVFKWAVRKVADVIRDTVAAAGVEIEAVDAIILHQANMRIIDAVTSEVGLPPERVVVNLDQYGNTSAGSVPLALDEARRQGKVNRGDLVLTCGFGAGLTWGSALLRW